MKKLFFILKNVDLYGQDIKFSYKRESKIRSAFGGFVSLMSIILAIYVLVDLLVGWANFDRYTAISSSKQTSVNTIVTENKNISYILTPENFYVQFGVITLDSHAYAWSDIKRYLKLNFTFQYTTIDSPAAKFKPLNGSECHAQSINPYTKRPDALLENSSKHILCIHEDEIEMGFYPHHGLSYPTYVIARIYICENSTENNNSCASPEEIRSLLNPSTFTFYVNIPKTTYQFNDLKNPISRDYDTQVYRISFQQTATYISFLQPESVYIDQGLFALNYEKISTDFNQESLLPSSTTRLDENPLLLQYQIRFGYAAQNHYIKNQKVSDLLASFGGTANLIFNLGFVFAYFYNSQYKDYKIMKAAIEGSEKAAIEGSKKKTDK